MFLYLISKCCQLYSGFRSYKALKNEDKREIEKSLKYWTVQVVATPVEFICDAVFSWWFPVYYLIKVPFQLWIQCPTSSGANLVFDWIVCPILNRNEQKIDKFVATIKESNLIAMAVNTSSSLLNEMINYQQTIQDLQHLVVWSVLQPSLAFESIKQFCKNKLNWISSCIMGQPINPAIEITSPPSRQTKEVNRLQKKGSQQIKTKPNASTPGRVTRSTSSKQSNE